jgi:putative hydrolase of the HAD superfamily
MFDLVVTYDDTKRKKPDVKPFLLVLKKLKVKPEECLMVGDDVKRDLKTAKKLGMIAALAKYGQVEKEKGRYDYSIGNINQLLNLVKKLS